MPANLKIPAVTLTVALILAALYIGASWFLLQRFVVAQALPDLAWSRAMVIYNGIASVGFAAIGVLLGTSVQQVNLSAAQSGQAKAENDSKGKAQAIKSAITKLNAAPANTPGDLGGGPSTEATRVGEAAKILMDAL